MRIAVIAMTCLLLVGFPVLAQRASTRTDIADLELRPKAAAVELEIVLPDVASGRVQRRPVSDLMLRVSLVGGDVADALRLPNGAAIDRDAGLVRAQVYVVSGGRLLLPVEARCDRWIEDFAACSVACDGGAFGLKRRIGAGGVALAMVVGRLPRGSEEGARPGFNLSACDTADGRDQVLAPTGNRGVAEITLAGQ